MKKLEAIKQKLTAAGLKATHQRMVIMDAIAYMENHPTAEHLFKVVRKNNPSLSLGTVYKTLETFVSNRLIAKVATRDGHMRYDPRTDHHGHIYCTNTKDLVDYYDEDLDNLLTEFFKKKKVNNLRIKNISIRINGEKVDPVKEVTIK